MTQWVRVSTSDAFTPSSYRVANINAFRDHLLRLSNAVTITKRKIETGEHSCGCVIPRLNVSNQYRRRQTAVHNALSDLYPTDIHPWIHSLTQIIGSYDREFPLARCTDCPHFTSDIGEWSGHATRMTEWHGPEVEPMARVSEMVRDSLYKDEITVMGGDRKISGSCVVMVNYVDCPSDAEDGSDSEAESDSDIDDPEWIELVFVDASDEHARDVNVTASVWASLFGIRSRYAPDQVDLDYANVIFTQFEYVVHSGDCGILSQNTDRSRCLEDCSTRRGVRAKLGPVKLKYAEPVYKDGRDLIQTRLCDFVRPKPKPIVAAASSSSATEPQIYEGTPPSVLEAMSRRLKSKRKLIFERPNPTAAKEPRYNTRPRKKAK